MIENSLKLLVTPFLSKVQCDSARIDVVASDWGNRAYFRVWQGQNPKILMVCKDNLTRSKIPEFIKISDWLRSVGLSAPEIYETDVVAGLVLLEDFGTTICEDYDLMGQCLKGFQGCDLPNFLPSFQQGTVYKAHRRVVDWFVPSMLHRKNAEGVVETYLDVWGNLEARLPKPDLGFVHVDFHPANFMILPDQGGVKQCGILDFQDGCVGPIAYDYTNLLKDIRRDVPDEIVTRVLQGATVEMNAVQKENFEVWYKFLCAQFHLRIAGQVIKLSLDGGRDDLLKFLPRVVGYLQEELQDDLFSELRLFFINLGLDWDMEKLMIEPEFIASNAF